MLVVALLTACAPMQPDAGDPAGGTDPRVPASFAGTGDASVGDTGAFDTAASRADCTEADLSFRAETWLPPVSPVEGLPPAESAWVGGVLSNPCANDVTLTTPSACLLAALVLTDPAGLATEYPIVCDRGETPITVPAGESITELADASPLAAGTWGLEVRFTAGAVDTTAFEVVP